MFSTLQNGQQNRFLCQLDEASEDFFIKNFDRNIQYSNEINKEVENVESSSTNDLITDSNSQVNAQTVENGFSDV